MLRKHIVSQVSSYFPNRHPLSYSNLTKNMKNSMKIRLHNIKQLEQQHKYRGNPFRESYTFNLSFFVLPFKVQLPCLSQLMKGGDCNIACLKSFINTTCAMHIGHKNIMHEPTGGATNS